MPNGMQVDIDDAIKTSNILGIRYVILNIADILSITTVSVIFKPVFRPLD